MQVDTNIQIIAAIIRAYGKRVPGGAFEVRIPNTLIAEIPPAAAIEQVADPNALVIRLHPNFTIVGEIVTPIEVPVAPPAPLPAPGSDFQNQS
jgi:hypothetical protein